MRFRVIDRMLAALSGLLIVALGIALGLFGAGVFPNVDLSFMQGPFTVWQRVIIIAVALMLCLLGLHGLWMLFRRRADKGFIMQRTDMGDMSIAMSALKSMVKKCVDQHQEVSVKKIHIHRLRNGVIVDLKILLANGINIPLTVNVLQKQIKQYITSCSGVDVLEVRVQVDTSNLPVADKKEETPVLLQEAAPTALLQEDPVVETAAESILRHTEEPADYVEPVIVETIETVAQQEVPAEAPEIETVSVEELVENAVFDAEPVAEEMVEEPVAEIDEAAEAVAEPVIEEAFSEETVEAYIPEEIVQQEEAVEALAEEAEQVTEEAEAFVEAAAEEPEMWAQVGDAFVRQDEEAAADETAE